MVVACSLALKESNCFAKAAQNCFQNTYNLVLKQTGNEKRAVDGFVVLEERLAEIVLPVGPRPPLDAGGHVQRSSGVAKVFRKSISKVEQHHPA